MNEHANFGRGKLPPGGEFLWRIIHAEIGKMRTDVTRLLDAWGLQVKTPEPVLRDNNYVMGRIGVSDRTVRRFIQKGELKIHETINKMNYYLDEDVESLRRRYRGN
ncbi:hypothetical protein SAMN05660841_00133 [Sphingobacterium nematocida]|uniref:MerR HTH family regulatory protein n=1 Tax=Sphingobacterium nematocida TaxID=1513896 RepID=A0A1T5ASS2_9SPHI|nr:MerR family transcriptional regulator [Sphingobacterium nematocida]SKB37945.1 hypothetical protein SAMN05660841_00133 [Sphingobacterium nematocida]